LIGNVYLPSVKTIDTFFLKQILNGTKNVSLNMSSLKSDFYNYLYLTNL